ncbi:histidine phosphatase family protein [Patescibacteria group bacterium]|nr:histidine phosphatase family protein [Patescibacteria group bacterium]
MQNIYFILRHGQTSYQVKKEKICYPWPEPLPILLTEKGKKQIKVAAKKLKEEKIDLIYASDIPRARQTAEIVAQELGLGIIFDSQLQELNSGIFRGRMHKELWQYFSHRKELFFKPVPQGESWNDVKERMMNFLKEVEKKYKNKKILIVSHGGPLWLLEGAVKGLDNEQLLEQKLNNTDIEVGELRKLCP